MHYNNPMENEIQQISFEVATQLSKFTNCDLLNAMSLFDKAIALRDSYIVMNSIDKLISIVHRATSSVYNSEVVMYISSIIKSKFKHLV